MGEFRRWDVFEIESYRLFGISAKTPGYEGTSARISLFWHRVEKAPLWFTFGEEEPNFPNSAPKPGLPVYYLRFRGSQLATIIDILRNESPVFMHWNNESTGAFITTHKKPVGEGEL